MKFEFDPVKAVSNLKKHRVNFSDAQAVFYDDRALTMEDPDAQGEQRFLTMGLDALGRILVVCYTEREERTRIVSARKAEKSEVKNYYA
ncbi:MAG: BrnT family toxin [Rhodoferax sp.]|nr:BrnT family toxin [Rhodoferax sp.]